jgi:ribonucleoside-diphosphate reductase alpha chain
MLRDLLRDVNNGMLYDYMHLVNVYSFDLPFIDTTLFEDECRKMKDLDRPRAFEEMSLIASSKEISNPQWGLLAGRLCMHNLYETTQPTFSKYCDEISFKLHAGFYEFVKKHSEAINAMIDYTKDFEYNVFSVKTLIKSYLIKTTIDGKIKVCERPQYMLMRVAVYLWYQQSRFENDLIEVESLKDIKEMFDDISNGLYSQASPTLFNSGLKSHQLASCFLKAPDDNMSSISRSWHDAAEISRRSGGLGTSFDGLRHSEIDGSGDSSGIVPWMKIEMNVLNSVDQGGKRKGSGTNFLSDWHIDIIEFIQAKRPEGNEETRVKDAYFAVWLSDLFMRRVINDEMWSVFCPNKVKLACGKNLYNVYGDEFEELYLELERKKVYKRQMSARLIMIELVISQIETGMPFMCYKDNINRKNNQTNLGTIRCSNLCVEINEFIRPTKLKPDGSIEVMGEIASCNLCSVCVNRYVKIDNGKKVVDYELMYQKTRRCMRNMNMVIIRNFYSDEVPEIKYANLRNKPIAIGIQGLADLYLELDVSWLDEEAKIINKNIAEVMYMACMEESIALAKIHGSYTTFEGSHLSRGLFQRDLWHMEKIYMMDRQRFKHFYDGSMTYDRLHEISKEMNIESQYSNSYYGEERWNNMRVDLMKYGAHNSLMLARMPTASSAQILGNNESFEPYTQQIYARSVLSGQFVIENKYMVKDMLDLGIWNNEVVINIIKNKGSIQHIDECLDNSGISISEDVLNKLKRKYLTCFELPQKLLVDMATDAGRDICQAMSMNIHMEPVTVNKVLSEHKHAWMSGAKTGMYYLRTKSKLDPINYSIDSISISNKQTKRFMKGDKIMSCSEDICIACT